MMAILQEVLEKGFLESSGKKYYTAANRGRKR
jgi:hypothetical protein